MAIESVIVVYNLDLKTVSIRKFPFLSRANPHSSRGLSWLQGISVVNALGTQHGWDRTLAAGNLSKF